MADKDAAERKAAQLVALKASVADATSAVASLDVALVLFLAEIVHPPPFGGQDMEIASIVLFSQGTIERRIEIVRKFLTHRLGGAFQAKPHEYPHKVAAFILKAFNKIADTATQDVWIRNTVAHGNFSIPQDAEPQIIPVPFDFEGAKRLHEKRGGKGPAPFISDVGFTASELVAFANSLQKPHGQLNTLRGVVLKLMGDPAELEQALVALGTDLKLQAPLRVRPHSKRREPKRPR